MDNHERSTLEQILAMLHGLIGRDDAKDDFRPDLSFVSDRPDSSGTETLIFPSRIFAEAENEKSPPASAEGTEKEKPDEDRREGRFLKFTDNVGYSRGILRVGSLVPTRFSFPYAILIRFNLRRIAAN